MARDNGASSPKKRKGPDKMTLNFIVNFAMLPLFLATVITGVLKFPGFLQALGISARRMPIPMEALTFIHDWAGLGMTALVLVHIIQHFRMSLNFLKGKAKKRKEAKKEDKKIPA